MSGNGKALRIHPPFSKYLKLTFDLKGVTEYLAFTLYMLHRYPWVSTAGTFSVCATANSQTSKPPIKSPPKKERPKLITVRQQISSHTLRDPRNLSLSTHTIDNHLLFHTIAPAPFIERKGGAVGTCKKTMISAYLHNFCDLVLLITAGSQSPSVSCRQFLAKFLRRKFQKIR